MVVRLAVFFCILIALTVNAQDINLRGKITGVDNAPVSGAIITLVGQNMKDTSGSDGTYEIKLVTGVISYRELQPESRNFIVEKGALAFSLPEAAPLRVELFDIKGNLLKREAMSNVPKGFYRFGITENAGAAKVLIIRVAIGSDERTFRYLPLKNGSHVLNQLSAGAPPATGSRLMKLMAIDDTVTITAEGYLEKKQAIVSYDQELNITLEPESSPDTGRSLGCGKTLGAINKSGTYTITTSGKNRTYMVRFPNNYDKTNPYRLIFGMHCMGASAQDIYGNNPRSDGAYDFYRLGPLVTNAILVAPQGPNSNGTWGGQEDHKFFDDLLDLLKDTLCIDTTRVFSVGFSFGAMYTYSLSLNHQDQLRAVVCFAPYDGVIWLPTNSHKRIAYMQTTGMSDGTCPWSGSKGCVTKHAEDNGCNDPTNIPTYSSGQYKLHDFQGCDEGYPVKVVTFGGGHTAGESWMPQMAWDFIKQF